MAMINGVKRRLVSANPGLICLISSTADLGSTTRMIMKIKKMGPRNLNSPFHFGFDRFICYVKLELFLGFLIFVILLNRNIQK